MMVPCRNRPLPSPYYSEGSISGRFASISCARSDGQDRRGQHAEALSHARVTSSLSPARFCLSHTRGSKPPSLRLLERSAKLLSMVAVSMPRPEDPHLRPISSPLHRQRPSRTASVALIALPLVALLCPALCGGVVEAASPKVHTVVLGGIRKVPFTPAEATPDTRSEETSTLKVRPLIVDGRQKEWTTGDTHDVTDRSFVVRRALRINDSLPPDATDRWVWQPGPWILIDRTSGHVTALHLPSFDSSVSNVAWFREYAAYCGIASTAKGGLLGVVAQLGSRKAVAQKQIGRWPQPDHPSPLCQAPQWQRLPMRVTMQPTGGDPFTIDVVGSTSLIEEGDNDDN